MTKTIEMRKVFIVLALILSTVACQGQPKRAVVDYVTTPEDWALAEKVLSDLKAHPGDEPGAQMVRAAKALLGQPYVAGTLEELPEEKLCIYLTRTDCILFVETCLGLVRTARQDGDFETLASELLQSRYRDGQCSRYEDRLHYTTEWALQGAARGTILDVSGTLGGTALDHPVHYMSTHPSAYSRMTDVDAIAACENRINAATSTYIPKAKLRAALKGIRNGDIIFFNTNIDGLDISHCAIALAEEGKPVRFIHASSAAMKVVVETKTLEEYVMGRKSATGIEVYRVR
jgi:cell wall-associated NlpC family hydrolase